jgi:hypothetical protein
MLDHFSSFFIPQIIAICSALLLRGEDPDLPGSLRLAAHLCGEDCLRRATWDHCIGQIIFSLGKQVGLEQAWCHGPLAFFPFARALNGDVRHIEELYKLLGVRRMQLNPTKAALE